MDPDQFRALAALYRSTDYCIDTARETLVLAVDARSEALEAFMRARGARCAAFITACNPRGVVLAQSENTERMQRLRRALGNAELEWLEGDGRARDGSHAEPSLLVFGLALEATHALMRRFEQNAFLWIGAEAVPQLVWTDDL